MGQGRAGYWLEFQGPVLALFTNDNKRFNSEQQIICRNSVNLVLHMRNVNEGRRTEKKKRSSSSVRPSAASAAENLAQNRSGIVEGYAGLERVGLPLARFTPHGVRHIEPKAKSVC